MAGRNPKLTFPKLRQIDAWWVDRKWSVKVMGRMVGASTKTIYNAALRRGGYTGCPR
jgi:hypothetical protein